VQVYPDAAWVLFTAIALFGVAQVLRALAIRVRNARAVHDLKVRVNDLRAMRYHQAMLRQGLVPRDSAAESPIEAVEVIDDNEARRAA